MPITTVATTLPYVAWLLLVSLASGCFAFVVITRERTDATLGYLAFTSVLAALLAALGLAADTGLPTPANLVIVEPSSTVALVRRVAIGALVAIAVVYVFALRGRQPVRLVGVAGLSAGVLVLVAAAVGWAPSLVDAVPLLVQLAILGLVAGGSLASVVLGHWYLVTPRISTNPLVLQTRLLLGLIGVQALLFIVWATLGGGVDQGPWDALAGPAALLVILRGAITIAFPLVLCYMALRTAQTRSMESATGLLYINLAAVLAGTIGAAALYVSSGILI